jgi:signal transduction histidine kinase
LNDSAIVLISVLATALTVIPVMLWMNKRERRRADQNVMRTMRRIANERTESQAILSSLNVGIVAYGSDNRLIASNPVAELYFGVIPDSLDSFLDRFGADNGMRAAYYLESDDVSGELDIDGYTLRLVCQQHPLRIDGEPFGGHIITAQDVTQFRRQEEQRKVFVANVSHELKTPLTTIKSYSETLLDWGIDEKSRDDIKSDVTRIYDDSIRMERLISDLLLLSTIDSSRLHVQMVLFDLSECARQICERFRDQSSAKSIALDFSVLSRQSIVLADRSSVERILTNLIVNAIHYTEAGGSIRVYAAILWTISTLKL